MNAEGELNHMLEGRLIIEPANGDNHTSAIKAANADGHATLAITDVIKKHGEVVGHLCIDGIPVVLVWMDTKKTGARDSLAVMNYYESIVKRTRRHGTAPGILLPCSEDSPFMAYLERCGYTASKASFKLFTKVI